MRYGVFFWGANWFEDNQEDRNSKLDASPSNLLSKISDIIFPALPPAQIWHGHGNGQASLGGKFGIENSIFYWKTKSTPTWYPNTPISTGLIGYIEIQRMWLKAPISTHEQKFNFIRQKAKSTFDDDLRVRTEEIISTEAVTVVIPAGQTYSAPLDLQPIPAIVEGYSMTSNASDNLLPVELAPEVLPVNSDFDEGRIDPATGYAIPDCDDIPGVDQKTGSGNTQIALNASRAHLDGLFANDEKVTDDMHNGWFGVNPNQLGDDFWNGANVTIRKIDKIDDETGYKESGQVRFYAKWSSGYYGIAPYDFQTLQPVNLVSAGVNLRPNEGVYGASSTIPDGAEFYMEGVRPGKIHLKWRRTPEFGPGVKL